MALRSFCFLRLPIRAQRFSRGVQLFHFSFKFDCDCDCNFYCNFYCNFDYNFYCNFNLNAAAGFCELSQATSVATRVRVFFRRGIAKITLTLLADSER
jgi:hypothetical protein